jgi:teichuronic acid biosynthesis glycosyltransferase TuaC
MKVLFVCSGNSGEAAPFIIEQADSIKRLGAEVDFFIIRGKGVSGYFKNLFKLRRVIRAGNFQLIHAHYGLSGLLSNLQCKVPVVTTYHGSDINLKLVRFFSILSVILSRQNIIVSQKLLEKLPVRKRCTVIPCGVNLGEFFPIDRRAARKTIGFAEDEIIILFSGSFSNMGKNLPLAKAASEKVNGSRLVELKGYSRQEVNLLFSACNVALMTSHTEGSPLFIKEAMACNTPVVSVPVGDIPEVINDLDGYYLCDYDAENLSLKLVLAIKYPDRPEGRKRILEAGLDSETVAKRIIAIYNSTINNN